jgi:CheY-like chemotaxis protein
VIFQPFQQEPEGMGHGGTGLGLAISRQHMALLGGQLEVESTLGAGARFFFELTLPQAAGPVETLSCERWSQVERLADGFALGALVVDDAEENREVLAQMLERIGVEVRLAEDGFQAIEAVRQHPADIVFMDIRMPGLDGSETRQRLIEEHGADVFRVVAVTASAFHHQRQQYLEEGFDDFIDKPFRSERIYACLAELLGVEFRYTTPESKEGEADIGGVQLPRQLYEGLESAARMHSITALNEHFEELEELGAGGRSLAVRLRELSQHYDMRAIGSLLAEIDVV